MVSQNSSSESRRPRIVAVAGGKGGAGKSLIAANLGIFLSTLGKRVVLVDGALGGANLHIFTGVARPRRTLSEALGKSPTPLADLVEPTPVPGLHLISGATDPPWIANPKPSHVRQLVEELRTIDADFVVVDTATGTGTHAIDMLLAADTPVLVAVPEPTSVELCYRFLRVAFQRQLRQAELAEIARVSPEEAAGYEGGMPSPLDSYLRAVDRDPQRAAEVKRLVLSMRPQLVINCVRSKADMELGRAVAAAGRRRLGLPITYLGHLEYDEAVWVAVRRRRPLLVEHPESRVSKCIEKVTRRLLAMRDQSGKTSDKAITEVVSGDTYYELLEVPPTASFEDIRRANRRIREVYGPESVVMSGLYSVERLEVLHRRFDDAYATLMDAASRKAYDHKLFPDGLPSAGVGRAPSPPIKRVEAPAVERPPMPELAAETVYTGPLLQQIREAGGIDLREIAERTKIGMAYLAAIEGENYSKLPAPVYVRGFLVEYTKILGLDGDRVIETYLDRYRAAREAGVAMRDS